MPRTLLQSATGWLSDLRSWSKNEHGGTASLFGFALLPMALSVGGAIDYSQAINLRQSIQQIADAGALYGASEFGSPSFSADALKAKIEHYVQVRLDNRSMPPAAVSANVVIDSATMRIDIDIAAAMPTAFMKLAGIDALDVSVRSRAGAEMSADICALALHPTDQDSIHFQGSGTVKAPNCTFWANSDAIDQAMRFQGSGEAIAGGFCAAGNSLVQNFTVSPAPRDYCVPREQRSSA